MGKEERQKKQGGASKRLVKLIVYMAILAAAVGTSLGVGLFDGIEDITSMFKFNAGSLVKIVIMIVLVLIISNLIQIIAQSIKPKKKRAGTIVTIISSLVQYVAAIVILCWGLSLLGISVSTIFASVGILALIVGFGAESLIEDVITGVFMIFENQYNVGDIIEVNGFRGTVKKIGIRTTVIADAGDNEKIINNSAMTNILNRSTDASKAICDFGIPYEADLEKVEEMLPGIFEGIRRKFGEIFQETPEYIGVQELGDSAVVLRVTAKVTERDLFRACRILNRELYLSLKKQGIEVPYNQVDVHTK